MLRINDLFNALTGRNFDKQDDDGNTRLYHAVRAGNLADVRKLLRAGADPNVRNRRGMTPLHQAAYWGEAAIAELLLKNGADPNADTGKGWTVMHSAALGGGMKNRGDIIALLRAKGARDDVKDKHGWTAADYIAVWAQNAEAAQRLRDNICPEHRDGGANASTPRGPRTPKH